MLAIQPATAADIPLIKNLAFAIWPAAYGAILPDGQLEYMLAQLYSETALDSQIKEGQQFFIAYNAGQPIGFAAIGPYDTHSFKLHKLYVLPGVQGKGAGRQLLHFAMDKAKDQKASRLILNVNRQNAALHFYKKMGFEITAQVDVAIGEGYFMNDYIMAINL